MKPGEAGEGETLKACFNPVAGILLDETGQMSERPIREYGDVSIPLPGFC